MKSEGHRPVELLQGTLIDRSGRRPGPGGRALTRPAGDAVRRHAARPDDVRRRVAPVSGRGGAGLVRAGAPCREGGSADDAAMRLERTGSPYSALKVVAGSTCV